MGKVVDATGRVNGLEKLRIVDASIMPSMTSGNLNAQRPQRGLECSRWQVGESENCPMQRHASVCFVPERLFGGLALLASVHKCAEAYDHDGREDRRRYLWTRRASTCRGAAASRSKGKAQERSYLVDRRFGLSCSRVRL